MKCHPPPLTPRGRIRGAVLAATLALSGLWSGPGHSAPQQPILPPDAAARPFLEGRDLVEKGRYAEAVPKLEEAIRTGHEKPQERFGTSRHAVDYYDPHYWLGRALMELGDETGSLRHLRASAAEGRFPDRRESEDRNRRIAELERREAARRIPPPGETLPPPTPPPTPAPSAPEPGPRGPEAVPTPAADTVSTVASPPVAAPEASPPPTPVPARLDRALAALAAGDFEGVSDSVRAERRRAPESRELDLVEAAAAGGRYVLEGRRDPELLATARASLAAFRRKGGSSRAEAALLSPTLRALLEPR